MKRIAVWFIETCLEVLLIGLVLTLLLGHDQHAFLKDVLLYSSGVSLLFFSTGYLLTTISCELFGTVVAHGCTLRWLQLSFSSTSRS
jgi:hypothetical protein